MYKIKTQYKFQYIFLLMIHGSPLGVIYIVSMPFTCNNPLLYNVKSKRHTLYMNYIVFQPRYYKSPVTLICIMKCD